ncbi:MAG: FecR family protein, partial [bacterium]
MKKAIFLLLFTTLAFGEDFELSFFVGDILIKQKDKTEWIKASLNMVIKEGDQIRTGEDAKCEIKRKDDVIKIDSNATFVVKALSKKKDVFSVFFGKVWLRIKRLKEKKTLVETPTSVMGLRGTTFSVDVLGKRTITDLFEGELDIFAEGKRFILKTGERFLHDVDRPIKKRIEKRPLSANEMKGFKEIFKLPEELPKAALPQVAISQIAVPQAEIKKPKESLFSQLAAPEETTDLKGEIRGIRNELKTERLSILTVKERDFSCGRTMRDKWGNLVRVEQHLYRPTNSEIRFVNINKRDTILENTSQFSYGMIDAKFNKELPEDIRKWPEWIKGMVDEDTIADLHPEIVEFILSNGRPQDANADRMRWVSEWEPSKDELKKPTFKIDKGGDGIFGNYTPYSNDWKEIPAAIVDKNEFSNEERFEIYYPDNISKAGELKLNSWLINNDGKVLNENDFINIDCFDALENTAFEMRFESTNLLNKPIDIIFTADIIVAGIRELMG